MEERQNQIFVKNLSSDTDEKDLRNAFETFGKILEIKMPAVEVPEQLQRFAYIAFESHQSAKNALSMNDQEIRGCPVQINVVKEQDSSGIDGSKKCRKLRFENGQPIWESK